LELGVWDFVFLWRLDLLRPVSKSPENIFVGCKQRISGYFVSKESAMKKKKEKAVEQPAPFTPGITRAMVRQHAFELYRDKLPNHPLTVEDWVLAEKDLVNSLEADNLPK
jgi:hypothetical protein